MAVARRQRGIDVTTAADAHLLRRAGGEHLVYARTHRRVIITRDADFLRLSAADEPHAGVVYGAPGSRSLGDIVRLLVLVCELLEPAKMQGRVEGL
ncbi:MAG TPA: DUF5615 family PIN-like protein [Gemmataceae bacterium]|nr:DUF5615 family PIN-like protein [Gemmataceae bacterium]